jgi:hypothetical protein
MYYRNEIYKLSSKIEIDASYLGGPSHNGKRGKGTDKQPALFALSFNGRFVNYLKVSPVLGENKDEIEKFINNNVDIEYTTEFLSDCNPAYNFINNIEGVELTKIKSDAANHPYHLKWLHTVISNLKTFINGAYHGVEKKFFFLHVLNLNGDLIEERCLIEL